MVDSDEKGLETMLEDQADIDGRKVAIYARQASKKQQNWIATNSIAEIQMEEVIKSIRNRGFTGEIKMIIENEVKTESCFINDESQESE
jgi:hypothetical protein